MVMIIYKLCTAIVHVAHFPLTYLSFSKWKTARNFYADIKMNDWSNCFLQHYHKYPARSCDGSPVTAGSETHHILFFQCQPGRTIAVHRALVFLQGGFLLDDPRSSVLLFPSDVWARDYPQDQCDCFGWILL